MKQFRIQYLTSSIMLFIMLLIVGCTHNNGNIGKQFGQWKVESITMQDELYDYYKGNMFWSFQSSTVEIKIVEDNHETMNTFGNYRIMDDTLFITFPDEDRPPFPGLGLKPLVENELQIVRLTGSEMILAYTISPDDSDNGVAANVVIRLKKW